MEKKRVPGFIYIKSDALKQEVAYSKKTGWVYCEDKYKDGSLVSYSPDELALMEKEGVVLNIFMHKVKVLFEGTIVKIGQASDDEKRNKEDGGNDQSNNLAPPPSKKDVKSESKELDIF